MTIMRIFRVALFLILAVGVSVPVFSKPPTLDPTYGAPLPKLKSPAQSGPPAKWIWVTHTVGDQTVNARVPITLKAALHTAILSITADDAFTLFVNGQKVDSTEPIEQGWKQVHKRSIAPLLHAGTNIIAVRGTNSGGGAAGILVHLAIDHKVALQSDRHWKVLEASTPPANWTSASFDASGWSNATELAPIGEGPWSTGISGWPGTPDGGWYLAHKTLRPVSALTLSGHIEGGPTALSSGPTHVVVRAVPPGIAPASLLIDFGQELAGRIVLQGTTNTPILMTTGETREECFHDEPALDNRGPWTLTLSASDIATTPYTAFRYALLVFPSRQAATLTRLDCDHKYYPVTYRGAFACSDPLLTKIWYAGAYTAHLCMQEEIWDAPKRDRGLWCGDLHVTGATINDVFADQFLMERSIAGLRHIAQQGRSESELPTHEINELPGYTAAWFCELADFYRHNGDTAFLKSEHNNILTLLEFQKTDFDAQHLFTNPRKNWNFVDWAPDFVLDSPQSHMATDLFDVKGVREAIFLLRSLGDNAGAAKYETWAVALTEAARRSYVDPATLNYGDRLQTNIMAVYSGVATRQQKASIYTGILHVGSPAWKARVPPANLDCYPISPYYGHYLLQDFGQLGRQQDGIDLIRRYWGNMVQRAGTTTLWEKFDPAVPSSDKTLLDMMPYLSFCHGWSTGPTPFLSEYILGVRPTSGGMKTVEITPFLGDLNWIEGDVPTPGGIIHIRATKGARSQQVSLILPTGIDAQFGMAGNVLRVNGKQARLVRHENGISFVHLKQSGTYRIETIY